jgi:hypothetical protein
MNLEHGEPSGICLCCRTVSTCTYLKDFRRPALQCEDFESYEPRRVATAIKSILTDDKPKSGFDVERRDSRRHKGLCSICEDYDSCALSKPEGGVWHCEEYR